MSITVTVAGVAVTVSEKSLAISSKVNSRIACSFVIIDATGTTIFRKGQPVVISDSVLGNLFGGYIAVPKATNLYPNPHNFWSITTTDMVWLADKRTSNSLYTNQYGGTIVCDQVQQVLSQEGVVGNFALDYNHQETDWSAGGATLTNVIAATNAGDGNPGDGDLELALAGTPVTFLQQSQASFNAGTTGGGLSSPASGGVTFTSTQAIVFKANNTVPGDGNAYIYVKIWQGGSPYTIAAGDILHYDVWIADSCPSNNQMAAVDFVCTDGTVFRDSTGVNGVDLQGKGMHPNVDLTGLATNTWYNRRFFVDGGSAWVGKTIQYMTLAFEGDATGSYTAYFRNIYIDNGGVTKKTFFATTATATQVQPQTMQDNGYSAMSCVVAPSYERHGYMFSPGFSLTGAGICKSSYLNWLWTAPTDPATGTASTKFTFTITASIDGFATFQPCTLNGPIPGLLPGQSLSGLSLSLVYVFDNSGNDPTLTPFLSFVDGNVQPSYACTKSDSVTTINSNGGWNGGTLTKLTPNNGALQLNGFARTYDTADYSNQTQYGTGASEGVLNKVFFLTSGANTDAKSRCDFAGNNWYNFTMECDVYVNATFNIGLNYRTTNWVDANNTYGYLVDMSTTNIYLSRGSNSGGSGSNTLISSVGLTLSSGNWHRLKIVVNSTSGSNTTHNIYLDDVLMITSTDNTFNNSGTPGYVGFHIYNPTGSPVTGNFDNFGIVKALSGTWVSAPINISSLGTTSNSEIALQIDPATNLTLCTFLAEISLNNGSTWTTCVNSAASGYYYTNPVPGLTAGTNVSGMTQVQIRLTITATTAATGLLMPDLTAVTLTVLGAYSATGTWISPALSLARVANAATSLVNWNVVLPNGSTSLVVKTSINGGSSYQTIAAAGNPIPNIALQPLPTVDTFTANTSSSYTQTHGNGGSTSTNTWNTANSRLKMVGGTSGLVLSNAPTSVGDVDLLGVFGQAEDTGLVWRYTNANTYYELIVRDAGAASNSNTFTLNRMSGGVLSQISQQTIVYNANTYHSVRVTMIGGVITATFDGVQILTYTDGSPLAGGLCGLRNSTGTSYCYQLRIQPYGQNVSALSVLTKLILASTDPTVTPQVLDSATLVADPTISAGALVPTSQFQGTFVSSNIDTVNKQSNTWWSITQSKQIIFQAQNATPAPWVLQSTDAATTNILVSGHGVEYSGALYRNRQTLKNVNATYTGLQVFNGDGTTRMWTLTYPIAANTVPVIQLNGQTATVGIQNVDTGKQFYYQVGSASITQDASLTLLQKLDLLSVTYTGAYLTSITLNNTSAITFPGTTTQAMYAAIDGTSGIVEAVEDLVQDPTTASMTVATATVYGNGLLQRYGVIGRTVTFKTLQTGLAVGQQLSAFLPAFSIQNVQFLVSQIDLTETITSVNGVTSVQYWFLVTAIEGPALDHWTKIFNGLLR